MTSAGAKMKLTKLCVAGGLICGAGIALASHNAPSPAPAANDPHAQTPAASSSSVSPDDALKRLVEGNQRYLSQRSEHARADQARRCNTFANGQHPFAIVLSCADSRAPVELMFDQGIGDLFVVRVAGNVADTDEIGTIEYGAEHLHSALVVVLGHTKCGAVTAVVNGAKVSENIAKLVDNIAPAVEHTKHDHPDLSGDALIGCAIEANVMQSIQDMLTHSEEMQHLVGSGQVRIVGAVYDIHNGTIQWLGEHPRQSEFLKTSPAHTSEHHEVHAAPHAQSEHESHDSHEAAAKHPEPATQASGPTMPHQNGKLSGMLIPAAFLGGAGLFSSSIFFRMKARVPAEATTTVESH
jgi:carbonic anhydrase